MSKTSLIIMDRGWQHFWYDEVDQIEVGFKFHKFWVLNN
jgi:hypothetical protein